MSDSTISAPLTEKALLSKVFKDINLVNAFRDVHVEGTMFYATLRRLIERLPIDATLRVMDDTSPLISMNGYSLLIERKVYPSKTPHAFETSIDAELLDNWPEPISRALARINVGTGVLLALTPDGRTYETTDGWFISKDGKDICLHKNVNKHVYLELTITPTVAVEAGDQLTLDPYIV